MKPTAQLPISQATDDLDLTNSVLSLPDLETILNAGLPADALSLFGSQSAPSPADSPTVEPDSPDWKKPVKHARTYTTAARRQNSPRKRAKRTEPNSPTLLPLPSSRGCRPIRETVHDAGEAYEARIVITSVTGAALAKLDRCLQRLPATSPFRVVKLVDFPTRAAARPGPDRPLPVTHVVTSCAHDRRCPRTLKYMYGVLAGSAVVDYRWVLGSVKAGRRLPEADYAVVGDTAHHKHTNSAAPPAPIASADSKPLFYDLVFYFDEALRDAYPNRTILQQLARFGGAKVLTRYPAGSRAERAALDPQLPVVIVAATESDHSGSESPESPARPSVQTRSTLWLFDCISSRRILP
ncbi:BRCA1-associated RING domain protein 1 [Tieghemiomyces parasiticus]|uniref:BRCA1-associated RING domain protein 1 n=1 Tax=Tieghemiomyces parasiticus TaxID=78921 RepID=A0A9W8AIP3_9FUNG|nr:BRCA1-associated RING domain protein 1 [Tieghemiomyces parasiticus]